MLIRTESIIFVHGLKGNSRDTWQSSTNKRRIFWPKELLARDLNDVRILSFGYEGNKLLKRSTFLEITTQLAQEMLATRKEFAATRQIIWVAHSLGGVLVKAVSQLHNLWSLF